MKKKLDYSKVMFDLMIYLGILAMGVVLGMLLQQASTQSTLIKVAEGLEGTIFNIEIDFNETLIVDRIHENLGLDKLNLTESIQNREGANK